MTKQYIFDKALGRFVLGDINLFNKPQKMLKHAINQIINSYYTIL